MLVFFSSDPFYNDHIKLPHEGIPVPPEILNHPKFHSFFNNALGAIDSTHFNCCPSAAEQQVLSQRCYNPELPCDLHLQHEIYICLFWLGGFHIWFNHVPWCLCHRSTCPTRQVLPCQYRFSALFVTCHSFLGETLSPQRMGMCKPPVSNFIHVYYDWLIIWIFRPQDAEELFNLHHKSAHNVIEHIFGVVKCYFHILVHPPKYDLDTQACLPPALVALHNFICEHDPDDLAEYQDAKDLQPGVRQCLEGAGELARGLPKAPEWNQAVRRWDQIAQAMWVQYQKELEHHRNEV